MDTLILGISPEEGVLMGRPSKFSPEFRKQAVELVRATGKTIADVGRDLQINDTTLGKPRKSGPVPAPKKYPDELRDRVVRIVFESHLAPPAASVHR